MTSGARGVGWGVALCCALWLGACSQQQMRSARDNTLGLFGFARKPAVAGQTAPASPPPAAASVPADAEPVPAAAPRTPVETERMAPPPGVRSEQKS